MTIVERLVRAHRASGGRTELVVRRHDPALGVRDNFADALAHATGDLIALSDQDDVWHKGKLAALTREDHAVAGDLHRAIARDLARKLARRT